MSLINLSKMAPLVSLEELFTGLANDVAKLSMINEYWGGYLPTFSLSFPGIPNASITVFNIMHTLADYPIIKPKPFRRIL